MRDIYSEIVDLRRSGRSSVLVTVVAREGHVPTELQCKMLVGPQGRLAGTVGGGALEKHALVDAQAVLDSQRPLLKEYLLDDRDPAGRAEPTGMICGGRISLFFEFIGLGDVAYLFGAGHVGRALRDYVAPLGFAPTFIDCRPEQLRDLSDPGLQAGSDYTELPDLPHLEDSYVVIATHSHVCDERVLLQLLAGTARPRYLGVVASRRKSRQIFAKLRTELGDGVDLEWIHMPVGLNVGGNTPAAVALSIAAEMQACRHGITGHRHLRDRSASEPPESK